MLNAFRHHRNSHFANSRRSSSGVAVLNAFRHHRNSHSRQTRRYPKPADRVLNAFRHHRNSHHVSPGHKRRIDLCSTPFGIIGILTLKVLSNRRGLSRAQRLSASSEFSQEMLAEAAFRWRVLNAFRHHRNSHKTNAEEEQATILCSTPFGIIGILTYQIPVYH